MSAKPYVVVGGGPVGLVLASYVLQVMKRPVVLIEQQAHLGGLYLSTNTQWGPVDQGVHIPQESGDPEIDKLFLDALPPDQWHMLSGIRKDIAGNIFAGRLDKGSLYPDLRCLPENVYRKCLADVFAAAAIEHSGPAKQASLHQFLSSRFGEYCTANVFEPIAQKLWRQASADLSPWAAKIVHLTRVVTHDSEVAASLKMSPALDSVIGFPDQLTIPEEKIQGRTGSFYPKKFGLGNVVNNLAKKLEKAGARILMSSVVARLEMKGDALDAIHVTHAGTEGSERIEVDKVIWTSPLPVLAKLLGITSAPLPHPPLPHRVVHLFLDAPPNMGELYWLWSYDTDDTLIRVSNPHAYCADASKNGLYPVCAELHVPASDIADADVATLAETQLRIRGIVTAQIRVQGAYVHQSNRAFFVPTIANCEAMKDQRGLIESQKPANLMLAMQDISTGIFYMPDILKAGVSTLNNR